MHLRDYVRILRRTWILVVSIVLIFIAISAVRTFTQTPLYTATSKAFISTSSAANIADVSTGTSYAQQIIKSYADVATSPYVLNGVIRTLGLDESADQLGAQIAASAPLDEVVLQISVTDASPTRAARIANAVTAELRDAVGDLGPQSDGTSGPVKITQITPALAPVDHTSPTIGVNLVTGAVAGLVLGLLAAFAYEGLNTRLRAVSDLREATDQPVLGQIIFDPDSRRRPLLMQEGAQGFRAEAFRTLRTNLDFLDVGEPVKSFVFTSSVEAEGKSTTVANLALALSEAGQKVVLVDGDLRRPRIADMFNLVSTIGLTDVLIGRTELGDAVQELSAGGLHVLPAGVVPPNPSELLRSSNMQKVIEDLQTDYDLVLFDAPPLLPVSDAAILARRVNGAVLVCAVNKVRRPQLQGSEEKLRQVGAQVFGIIATMVPPKQVQARNYAGYDQSLTSRPWKRARGRAPQGSVPVVEGRS